MYTRNKFICSKQLSTSQNPVFCKESYTNKSLLVLKMKQTNSAVATLTKTGQRILVQGLLGKRVCYRKHSLFAESYNVNLYLILLPQRGKTCPSPNTDATCSLARLPQQQPSSTPNSLAHKNTKEWSSYGSLWMCRSMQS